MARLHIIGAPLDLGGGRRGVDMGPSAMRIAGIGERLSALQHIVRDEGDLDTPTQETIEQGDPRQKYLPQIAEVCAELHRRALAVLQEGGTPVVLGGDHSVAAGSVSASAAWARQQGKPLGLLWVDAHGDMNTPETTLSGNVHGMPLAALLGNDPRALAQIGGFAPKVSPQHTALIGVRNLDEREKAAVRASGVHVFTMKDIDRLGIAAITEKALAIATAGTVGVHVSFDVDVCDPTIAPGVGTPVKGGLDYREAHMVMEMVADAGRLIALDLVEVNPVLDVQNATAILAAELAASAFGMEIL
ncbi:MAG TPA: arginase [Vicinamibacterales bacterium]